MYPISARSRLCGIAINISITQTKATVKPLLTKACRSAGANSFNISPKESKVNLLLNFEAGLSGP